MAPPASMSAVVRFAEFEVDLRAGELRKHGRRIRLQEQPLLVLSMLLNSPGQLVSREELRLKLWPADTFVDFDHGLNSAVARLRETLNDSAEQPRFVQTIPRRGYRFIGEATREAAPQQLSSPPPVLRRRLPAAIRAGALAASLALVLVLVALRTRGISGKPGDAPPAPEILPLAGLAGYEIGPAFSPDGKQVAFLEINGLQNSGIYTSLVGGENSLRLTRNGRDCCAAWSPDSSEVAFVRPRSDLYDIYAVPALGGAERRLYSTSQVRYPGLDWSPDGKLLAFPEALSGTSSSRIVLLSLTDSKVRVLTSPPGESLDRNPAFSQDGKMIAFVRGTVAGVTNDVYVVPTGGGIPKRLTFDNRPISGVAWTPDCTGDVIFSSNRGGTEGLWRIPAKGGNAQPVTFAALAAFSPSLSRRGTELAFQQAVGKDNIWRISVQNGRRATSRATIAIAAKGRKMRPSFSPDGTRIAFESDRLGAMEIWTCSSSGINCLQLTSLHGTAGSPHWSPDGQRIAFEFHPGERAEIYMIDVAGGAPRKIPTLAGADNLAPSWSRDGRWLYFSSKRGKEPFQIWRVPVRGGPPEQITKHGGIAAAESFDGRFLYYSKYEDTGIWRMPIQGGDEQQVLQQPDGTQWFNWGVARSGIYFLNTTDGARTTVDYFDFVKRKTSHIWSLAKPWGWGLAVSPDNQSLLLVQSEFEESNIMVVKNFR